MVTVYESLPVEKVLRGEDAMQDRYSEWETRITLWNRELYSNADAYLFSKRTVMQDNGCIK